LRRINLLPQDERRWRPFSGLSGLSGTSVPGGLPGLLAIAGAALVVVLAGVYLIYAVMLGNVEEEIASLDEQISGRQARVAELQPFDELQAGLDAKKPVADGIYRTRFAWDGLLEGLAFVTPDTTSLESFEGEASQVDVSAQSGEVLSPPGSIAFDGLALADYRNVADFVVQMNALSYLENSELDNAELDRETYEEPAILFQVTSRLLTTAGENGDEVPLDGSGGGGISNNSGGNGGNGGGG
jgi:Tfp pilus assembly protein PilN